MWWKFMASTLYVSAEYGILTTLNRFQYLVITDITSPYPHNPNINYKSFYMISQKLTTLLAGLAIGIAGHAQSA